MRGGESFYTCDPSSTASARCHVIARAGLAHCRRRVLNSGAPPLRLVDWIDPGHMLRLLDRFDGEIDHDGLFVAAHQHAFERLVGAGIEFLIRHIRRYENEVAGSGLRGEYEPLAPAHA